MMLDTSGSMGRTIQSGYSIYDDYGITSCSTTYVNSTTTLVIVGIIAGFPQIPLIAK